MTDSSPTRPPSAPDVTEIQWDSIEKHDILEYSADSETYRASFNSDTDSVCSAILSTVAAVSETPPLELPPLYSACDPDALETLVEPTVHGASSAEIRVSFTFHGYTVTVHNYGIIAVHPPQADGDDSTEGIDLD